MEKFKPPIDIYGNPYWVPIVAKNKDWLIAFLYGYYSSNEQINNAMKMSEMDIHFEIINIPLNSYRYCNILPNGKDSSKLSKDELEDYMKSLNEEASNRLNYNHVENVTTAFLTVECTCGLGFYSWNSENDIPDKDLKCSNCGKYVIIYTNKNECDFEKPSLVKDR